MIIGCDEASAAGRAKMECCIAQIALGRRRLQAQMGSDAYQTLI
jgi:hypothetical protein